jgi:hypothetical protein
LNKVNKQAPTLSFVVNWMGGRLTEINLPVIRLRVDEVDDLFFGVGGGFHLDGG